MINAPAAMPKLQADGCWFCGSWDDSHPAKCALYQDLGISWGKQRWNRATVLVPRCQRCFGIHMQVFGATLLVVVGFLIAAILGDRSKSGDNPLGYLVLLLPLLILFRYCYPLLRRTKPASYGKRNPKVLVERGRGWKFGYGPKLENMVWHVVFGTIR